MTAEVISLERGQAKKSPPGEPFRFSKTSLRQRTADADAADLKNVTLRDAGLRGFILKKQRRDWVFAIERRINKKLHRIRLAEWTTRNDVDALRRTAEDIIGQISAGTYMPAEERAAAEALTGSLTGMTLRGALDLHAKVNPHLRGSTIEQYGYSVNDLVGAGDVAMSDIDTAMVRECYDRLAADKSVATATRMLRTTRALWNTWADEHPDGSAPEIRNPVERLTRKRGRVGKVKSREGALAPAERRPWLDAIEADARSRGPTGNVSRALAFVFLTGMRRQEVFGLRWDEVGEDSLTVTADRMKSGEPLTRPLTKRMRAILDYQRRTFPESDYVFPANRGGGHIIDPRKTLKPVNKDVGVDITVHDLRRTYIGAAELAGVPTVAIKMLVGHSTSDITEAYAKSLRSELPDLADQIEAALVEPVE